MKNKNKKRGNIKIISLVLILIIALVGGGGYYYLSKNKKSTLEYTLTTTDDGNNNSGDSIEITAKKRNNRTSIGSIENVGDEQMIAYVSSTIGSVEVKSGSETSEVVNGYTISVNDILSTKDDGEAEIIFSDNSVIRMNNNTTITFTKLESSSEINLNNGEVWARVLKPLLDSSFFTIKTSDLSAGVQGTSVFVKKGDEGSEVNVLDSYAKDENKLGVKVSYLDGETNKLKEAQIKPKNGVLINTKNKLVKKAQFEKIEKLANEFIANNTKKDLVYMDGLKEKIQNVGDLKDRIDGELKESMPKMEELKILIKDTMVKKRINNIEGVLLERNEFSSADKLSIIKNLKRDVELVDGRKKLTIYQNRINSGLITPEQKQIFEQRIDEQRQIIDKRTEELNNELGLAIDPNSDSGDNQNNYTIKNSDQGAGLTNPIPTISDDDLLKRAIAELNLGLCDKIINPDIKNRCIEKIREMQKIKESEIMLQNAKNIEECKPIPLAFYRNKCFEKFKPIEPTEKVSGETIIQR